MREPFNLILLGKEVEGRTIKSYSLENSRRKKTATAILFSACTFTAGLFEIAVRIPLIKTIFELEYDWSIYLKFGAAVLPPIMIAFLFIFDCYIWKWHPISELLQVPNLNGTWIGTITQKNNSSGIIDNNISVILEIKQRYFEISTNLISPKLNSNSLRSTSKAHTIGISGKSDTGYSLDFIFDMENDDRKGFGANELTFEQSKPYDKLIGTYVSDYP